MKRVPFRFRSARIMLPALVGSLCLGCNVAGPATSIHTARSIAAASAGREADANAVDISVIESREVDLVEAVALHRRLYRESLEKLRAYYAHHGYATKQTWAGLELEGLGRVNAFAYLMDAEIPSEALTARDAIPEADAMYDEAVELMRRGGHGVPAIYREDRMLEAARKLREIIRRFPSSDKIDDSAFLCGEIHKEYLRGQEAIAVKWYERAWTWDPETPHPARFEAAVVYDYRLHDRDRALELYQSVLQDDAATASDVRFATRRISELTESPETTRHLASPPRR